MRVPRGYRRVCRTVSAPAHPLGLADSNAPSDSCLQLGRPPQRPVRTPLHLAPRHLQHDFARDVQAPRREFAVFVGFLFEFRFDFRACVIDVFADALSAFRAFELTAEGRELLIFGARIYARDLTVPFTSTSFPPSQVTAVVGTNASAPTAPVVFRGTTAPDADTTTVPLAGSPLVLHFFAPNPTSVMSVTVNSPNAVKFCQRQ